MSFVKIIDITWRDMITVVYLKNLFKFFHIHFLIGVQSLQIFGLRIPLSIKFTLNADFLSTE